MPASPAGHAAPGGGPGAPRAGAPAPAATGPHGAAALLAMGGPGGVPGLRGAGLGGGGGGGMVPVEGGPGSGGARGGPAEAAAQADQQDRDEALLADMMVKMAAKKVGGARRCGAVWWLSGWVGAWVGARGRARSQWAVARTHSACHGARCHAVRRRPTSRACARPSHVLLLFFLAIPLVTPWGTFHSSVQALVGQLDALNAVAQQHQGHNSQAFQVRAAACGAVPRLGGLLLPKGAHCCRAREWASKARHLQPPLQPYARPARTRARTHARARVVKYTEATLALQHNDQCDL